ncbi:hypothetical protein F53441_13293 [Fusarium austroafricanum]|uniref:Uncharacterized protein n=1 Tax=Fusarium austroafricanum TaxID=2364996 RepID=A0A8H4JP41_9HYPO|nr:hypothetical protein F53441_13293 [Fusarium austroafricanum]
MFTPNSTDWKLHLNAIRTGLQRYDLGSNQQEVVSQFFVEELCYLEAFGSISSFSSIPRCQPAITQYPVSDDHFRGFTELLHEITASERNMHHANQIDKSICDDMSIWTDKLTATYDSACVFIDLTPSQDITTQMGLKAVLKAQYYACMVYSYQALATQEERDAIIPSLINCLDKEVSFITAWPAQAVFHDISFPLFILGSECRSESEKQMLIESLFSQYIAETGFSCNIAVLQFLREFWSAAGATENWIQYARENEETIAPFIVF